MADADGCGAGGARVRMMFAKAYAMSGLACLAFTINSLTSTEFCVVTHDASASLSPMARDSASQLILQVMTETRPCEVTVSNGRIQLSM